ncbi:DarT ssDNA thymidine ADP-ribosyltransferase family protein [Pseudomonas sp. DSP3-2-2]|uniref:DarT ssDNA thymidine ADP-ribosyltransferase family protein n=1 Tax=unclassified Pseudomonas TaxID=196821 RepID=UPI003CF0FD14
MTILYFQIIIVFTLYVTSLVGKKALVVACAAWTLFTLVTVFFSGLILLQLITIWMCYAFFKPEDRSTETTRPIIPKRGETAVSALSPPVSSVGRTVSKPSEIPPQVGTVQRSLDSVNNALTAFTDSISLSMAVNSATEVLQSALFNEKLGVEHALQRAQLALKVQAFREERGEEGWAHYQEAYARFTKVLKPATDVVVVKPSPGWQFPDFTVAPGQDDANLTNTIAIGARIRTLRSERDGFLRDIVRQVWTDEPLRNALRDELNKVGGAETWNSICQIAAEKTKPSARLSFGAILRTVPSITADSLQPEPATDEPETPRPMLTSPAEIEARVKALELPYLVHFTRVENLPSIMQRGLCSITTLTEATVDFKFNDRLRLEGRPDAVCLSIGYPNDKMFAHYRWKTPEQGWVVLVIDRCVLWTLSVAFCNHNAADNRIRQQSLDDLKTVSAFDNLFNPVQGLASREENKLLPFDPTDVQAEVLAFDTVSPDFIKGVVFSDESSLQTYNDCVGDRRTLVNSEGRGFLSARSYARKRGWTY